MVFASSQIIEGLSPPVRGSPDRNLVALHPDGSIPARAGEPGLGMAWLTRLEVYPRPCGGAPEPDQNDLHHAGLSPPVRGSPPGERRPRVCRGSIPARAGEPFQSLLMAGKEAVYPRPCGGAPPSPDMYDSTEGLSPPVRGSRGSAPRQRREPGSIPARAGEPPRPPAR